MTAGHDDTTDSCAQVKPGQSEMPRIIAVMVTRS
jgi:hypothetical protein